MLRDALKDVNWDIDMVVSRKLSEIDELVKVKRELLISLNENPDVQQEAIDRAEEVLERSVV